MIIKYDRNNTNFQIAYFIAGSCHTADAAYIALLGLRNDRQQALDAAEVSSLKCQAAELRAQQKMISKDPADQLEGQAELLEIEQGKKLTARLLSAAKDELTFINHCIKQVEPLRKYSHLSDHDAAEACQREEWLGELRYRAENYLLTQGSIPHDHFSSMRQHPDFNNAILPHIEAVHSALDNPGQARTYLTAPAGFDLPGLLGYDQSSN